MTWSRVYQHVPTNRPKTGCVGSWKWKGMDEERTEDVHEGTYFLSFATSQCLLHPSILLLNNLTQADGEKAHHLWPRPTPSLHRPPPPSVHRFSSCVAHHFSLLGSISHLYLLSIFSQTPTVFGFIIASPSLIPHVFFTYRFPPLLSHLLFPPGVLTP